MCRTQRVVHFQAWQIFRTIYLFGFNCTLFIRTNFIILLSRKSVRFFIRFKTSAFDDWLSKSFESELSWQFSTILATLYVRSTLLSLDSIENYPIWIFITATLNSSSNKNVIFNQKGDWIELMFILNPWLAHLHGLIFPHSKNFPRKNKKESSMLKPHIKFLTFNLNWCVTLSTLV